MTAPFQIHSLTFTPAVDCTLEVTATLDAQRGSGSDWDPAAALRLFVTQSGTDTYGDQQPITTTRSRYGLQYLFSVTAGSSVTCGVAFALTGAISATAWNCDLKVGQIKR